MPRRRTNVHFLSTSCAQLICLPSQVGQHSRAEAAADIAPHAFTEAFRLFWCLRIQLEKCCPAQFLKLVQHPLVLPDLCQSKRRACP